tara:strand:+ start:722 stop:997 length:276 start_codon:yes stop_codon:yes gene_type:complete
MPINQTEIFTKSIVNSIYVITPDMGFRSISFVLISGAGTFKGNLNVTTDASVALSLVVNNAVTLSSDGPNVVGQVTIDTSATGTVHLVCKQ